MTQRLFTFTLESEAWVHGGECILSDGQVLDVTTSGGYGYTLRKPIVMGYIPIEYVGRNAFEVEVFGETHRAIRHDAPLHDPTMARMKA